MLIIAMLAMFVPSGLVGTTVYAANFTLRLTAPERTGYYSNNTSTNPYSVNTNAGGGNCTWYAWGRAYEILGSRPKINTSGNACTWYTTNQSSGNYPYGSTPKLGAIACWSGGSGGAGHVAVVEQINSNGTMVISESSWSATDYWFRTATINQNGSRWSNYTFQGFIYLLDSATVSVPEGVYVFHCVRNPDRVLDIQGDSKECGANIQLYDNWYNQVQKFRVVNMGDYYCIQSVYSGMWLDIASPYNQDGCNIQLWNTNTSTEQKWVFEDAGNGNYYIRSLYGKYLDTGGPTENNTNIQTYHFDGTTSQQWSLELTSPYGPKDIEEGIYTFHNYRNPSRVMDIQSDSTEVKANIQLYDDLNNSVQRFKVSKVLSNTNYYYYLIQSVYSGYWLDIEYPSTTSGCNIQLWQDYNNPEEKWVFEDAGNGKVLIRSLYGTYVDLENGKTDNWTNIQSFNYDGSTSMEWVMHKVYSVSYDANGGINAPETQGKQTDISMTISSDVPNRSGFTFRAWNTKADGSGNDYYPGASYSQNADLLLYAQWNAAAYTVTYDANGGTNAPEAQRKTKGENLTLTTNKPSRNGYEFIGWSTDENATSPTYTAGATFTIDADTTLYAVWKQISSIEIVTMPDKLDYNTYELLNVSGMKLKVSYSDSSTRVITMGTTVEGGNETVIDQESGTVFSPRRLDNIGSHEVTVNYAGLTATFNVNVDDPTLISITIEKLPDKLTYNVGDTLDTTGITVYANYSRTLEPEKGPDVEPVKSEIKGRREITEGFTCTPTVLNTAGTQEITVDYYGRTATFNVMVNRVLTSVTIKTNPDKLIYTMGDTLDLTGLVLTASYNDGYTEDIASGFTCTPTELNTVGTQEITVEYEGKTTTFNVTVNKIVTSVFVMANPNKTTYSAGDMLDTTGMKLLVVYHDGSTQTIMEGFTCTPTDLTTVGTQEITAEYGGKTATFEVTVKEAYSLKASPASEQTIGEPVVLTATGGSSYRFYYEQNGKWVNIRNFSTENACLWIPTVPREYTIYVDIKDETGKVVTSKRIQYTVTDAYPFTLDKEGEQNVGVNMTLTAKGGSSYKFYYEYNGAWCNITFNTTGVCEWSPKFAGNYMLYVDIKDASGKVIACRTQAFKLNDPFLLANDAQSTEFSYGRTVNFTAAGGNQYKFYYEKQGEWQRVQDFSSKNTCAWTPTEAGTYNFYCDIKDASGAVVSCKRMTFNITNPYSFTADKATTQPVGTKITFTATGGYQYKFYYEKDGSWVRIQSFSTENTCSWTPTVAGRYNVYCDIADENGTVLAYKGIEFVIGNAGTTDYTFITSVESPQPMNTSVILSATGGASYKFYYEVGGKWATVQNFSSANTATWTPDMIADYTLYVDIKNSSGKVVKTISKKFSATDPYSFTADVTSPQNIGKIVKFTAAGGASYKFYYQYAGAWVKIQDSTSATCNWKPNKAGEYMVYVDIKNASGAVVTCRTMKLVFNDPYRFTTSASSLTQPAGTAVSLSANGGASYKFYYEKDGAWVRIQDYSTTKTCTWAPIEAGKYNVFCDIKDASGSVAVCKRITFNITEKCTITASNTNASVGDTITFTATGGSSYKFYYEKDGAWVRIQSFSTSNTCNWKPTAAGDYVVYVDVNDANGNLIGCKGVRCVVG